MGRIIDGGTVSRKLGYWSFEAMENDFWCRDRVANGFTYIHGAYNTHWGFSLAHNVSCSGLKAFVWKGDEDFSSISFLQLLFIRLNWRRFTEGLLCISRDE